jgi:hypothetical protein
MNSWSNTALQAMTLTEGDKMLLTPTYQRGVLTLSAGAN